MTQQILNEPFLLGPDETDRACLLIHGFSGTTAEMRGLGEALAAQGIQVYGVALAGHTGNLEDLARSKRRQWIASAEDGLARLADYPHVFVVGLSMGGILSLLIAAQHPERIAGVVTLSTATRFPGDGRPGSTAGVIKPPLLQARMACQCDSSEKSRVRSQVSLA